MFPKATLHAWATYRTWAEGSTLWTPTGSLECMAQQVRPTLEPVVHGTTGQIYIGTTKTYSTELTYWEKGLFDWNIHHLSLREEQKPGSKAQVSGSPVDPYSGTGGQKYLGQTSNFTVGELVFS